MFFPQRRARRTTALTLVFAGVLATGAAAGSWDAGAHDGRKATEARAPAHVAGQSGRAAVGRAGGADEGRDEEQDGDEGALPEDDEAGRPPDPRAVEAAAGRAAADGKSGAAAAAEVIGRSGDRWSSVYSARAYAGLERALDGVYIGVGLTARPADGGGTEVDAVRPGGPAEREGIRAGDLIRSVDGVATEGRPVAEVVALLRGDDMAEGGADEGTPVRIGLRRSGGSWERTVYRARLATENVAVERLPGGREEGPGATRIRVDSFTRGTGERIRRAARTAARGEGILLDLRGNSGGLVTEAVGAASAFLDGGLVATYDVPGGQRTLEAAPGGDTGPPLVVLVDGGTMSAGELLAGALQDRGRAVVVGTRTFGKGSVQLPDRLPDGSVAELTVGHWRTPSGHAVEGRGIAPDVVVRSDAEHRARTVLSGLRGGS